MLSTIGLALSLHFFRIEPSALVVYDLNPVLLIKGFILYSVMEMTKTFVVMCTAEVLEKDCARSLNSSAPKIGFAQT